MNNFEQSQGGGLKLAAPAKVNLMLSVHSRRSDGFHELTSVVAALEFGDELELRLNDSQRDRLSCEDQEIPLDENNLVLQAAHRFREFTGRDQYFDFVLTKRIPVGAGLGGGSSDCVAALKGMNALTDAGLDTQELRTLAATLGSDCPFFVDCVPSIMRGRGEVLEPLEPEAVARLSGLRVLLFRPPFAVPTAWAYGQMVAQPEFYEDKTTAETLLSDFFKGGSLGDLLHNSFELPVGRKFPAIPCLMEKLRGVGSKSLMSGSGSACFTLLEEGNAVDDLAGLCRSCWGPDMFWVETSIAGRKI